MILISCSFRCVCDSESIADTQNLQTAQGDQDSEHQLIVNLTTQLMAQDIAQVSAFSTLTVPSLLCYTPQPWLRSSGGWLTIVTAG